MGRQDVSDQQQEVKSGGKSVWGGVAAEQYTADNRCHARPEPQPQPRPELPPVTIEPHSHATSDAAATSHSSATGIGNGGVGGRGGDGGKANAVGTGGDANSSAVGKGGEGGRSNVDIDNSDRSSYTDKSIFWAPYREATQAVTPGMMGGRLSVALPSGNLDYSVYGPQSSSAFNLNLDLALPGSGFGAGLGIGSTHTGDAPPEVKTAVKNIDDRAGVALDHLLMKDR